MTDAFYTATAITAHDQVHAPIPNTLTFTQHHQFGAPAVDAAHEDDGQISCFCGYPDDDGNTVACDICNRWQHTICYYPEYEGQELPADLSHYCVDCRPRIVNGHAANARQQSRREQQTASLNGPKRQIPKSHKKKVKEPNGAPYTNGWAMDKSRHDGNPRHDRNSASPRDQPPPAKRPKTTHRTSDSATNSTKSHSRKRTMTNTQRRSLSRSPESPIGFYSEEFLRCYHHDEWSVSHANVMDELRVTNALSEWLQAPDDVFFEKTGTTKPEVLNRWDGELDDIPGKVPLEVQEHTDQGFQDHQGNAPAWKSITVRDPLAPGAYIGELRGRIGFKDEYKTDAANRWSTLRHPEPFVFFHHRLPIYIDARHEGTELRYVRRSCTPNARLQVLVTNGIDYHFCFMATTQIDPGMEVAVGWDTTDSILRHTAAISQDDMAQLSTWVSTVLANCGPCACQLPPGECYMSRFDKRRSGHEAEDDEEAQSSKLTKSKKTKTDQHVSPLNTHALNSRSVSEARKIDLDEEPTDSRSVSGSAGRGSDSRDITPNTHYSANGSLSTMPELSERERKKLAREEEIFRRQEEEQSGKQAKKKRHSAGSNATTPAPTSSKQATFPSTASRYSNAGTSKQSGLPSANLSTGKRGRPATLKTPVKSNAQPMHRPRPAYTNASTQCDLDEEEANHRAAERAAAPRKKYVSLTQRLLQRCAMNNSRTGQGSTLTPPPANSAKLEMRPSPPSSREHSAPPMLNPEVETAGRGTSHEPATKSENADDVPMHDVVSTDHAHEHTMPIPRLDEPIRPSAATLSQLPAWAQHPAGTSVPPSHSKSSPTMQHSLSPSVHMHNPGNLHLPMPPPQPNPFAAAHAAAFGATDSITGSIAQSPAGLSLSSMPLFSPAVTAAVAPSPARKKMSLSDYTKRTKAKDRDPTGDRESSPASVVSASGLPLVPGLPHSSSQFGSQAVEDDVKMEDAGGP